MKKFRQKYYTIPEGHFTGQKDMDEIPGAVEVLSKSVIGGALAGGIYGKISGRNDDDKGKSKTIEDALRGGKWGLLGGIALKLLINHIHTPMNSVKYQEVDKSIRREFGVYKAMGLTVGDSVGNRASIDERFSFNDRDVTNYKLNFSIQDNQVTMYTFGMTNDELNTTSKTLDYYTQKYFGMNYTSVLINKTMNAYGVIITFTNYQVITDMLMELSEKLKTKINLLNNKAVVSGRIKGYDYTKCALPGTTVNTSGLSQEKLQAEDEMEPDKVDTNQQRSFSNIELSKYDMMKILSRNGITSLDLARKMGIGTALTYFVMNIISDSLNKLQSNEFIKAGMPAPRKDFGNSYLLDTLDKLHYVRDFNYTVDNKNATTNFSMANGTFIVTTLKDSDDQKLIDEKFYNSAKSKIRRTDMGKTIVYLYVIESRNDFEFLLKKLFSTKLSFNLFNG